MSKKLMIILDHYEQDMFHVSSSGELTDNFAHSKIGRTLMKEIIGHPQKGINTKGVKLDVAFFYDRVPEQSNFTKAYIKPHVDGLQKSYDQLIQRIQQDQPDLIVTYGHWFSDLLAKEYQLDQSVFKPQPIKINDFQTYITFCPNPKKIHFMKSASRDKLIIENHMINRFLKGGLKACEPQMGHYQLVTNFDQVKTILTKTVYQYPIVAVDFETNTLHTYLDGAKAIMISLSWKDHQGVAIPLDHRLAPNLWTKDQFNQIINWIKKLMDSKQWKVLHNCIYDIHMLMDVYGLEHATHCVDTMLMYYELVDESQGAQRGLKHLAYLYTDMGGYEDTRDEAFQKYLTDYYQKWLKTEMTKYEAGKRKTKPSHRNYTAPTNEIDGAPIDFEWLPMEVVYPYAAADTDVTLQIYHKLKKRVSRRPKWHYVIYEYYPKLCDTLSYMQHVGFQVNRDKFEDYKKHFNQDIKDVTQKIYDSSPEVQKFQQSQLNKLMERQRLMEIDTHKRTKAQKKKIRQYSKYRGTDPRTGLKMWQFNPGSGRQIGYILYHMMHYELPAKKDYLKPKAIAHKKQAHPETLTWEDFKTDRQVALPYIRDTYHEPLVDLLLRYSTDKKMISSVIDGYGKLMDKNSRLHSTFKVQGCLSGDTLLSTNEGIKYISQLSGNRTPGKFELRKITILNSQNKAEQADKFFYSGVQKAYRVRLENGNSITATANHPFLGNVFLNKNHRRKLFMQKKPQGGLYVDTFERNYFNNDWVRVKDLHSGDWILGSIGSNLYGNNTKIDFDSKNYKGHTSSVKIHVNLPTELTENLAEFLGIYTADGSYSSTKKRKAIGITNDDPEVQKEIVRLSETLFNITPYVDHGRTSDTFEIASVQLFNYLKDLFQLKSRAPKKRVPKLILEAPKNIQQAFLRGLTLDSSVRKKKYPSLYLCTTSKQQAHEVNVMLLNMGIYARVAKRKLYHLDRQSDHPTYDVMITHQDAKKFVQEIGFIEKSQKEKVLLDKLHSYNAVRKPTYRGVLRYKNFVLYKIKSIDYVGKLPMFDLSVPKSHSFWANGIISHNTATGRLASASPNAQNYKKPTSDVNDPNYNYSVKGLFYSRFKDGYIFNIDYKSLEVFIATLISHDTGMMQALMDGADIHKRNASIAFDIPYDEVDPEHRQLAKSVTFGLMYGEGAQGLSDSRGLTLDEAKATIKKVMKAMPQIDQTNQLVQRFVKKTGFVETIAGHVRRLPGATQRADRREQARSIRQSFNAVVQGSGAFCTNTAIILIRNIFRKYHLRSKLVITVHDSVVIDCHPDEIPMVPQLVQKTMQSLPIKQFILEKKDFPDLKIDPKYMVNDHQFRFPLFAEISWGKTYADGLDMDFDDLKQLGIEKYYEYSMKCKYVSDTYNTQLSNEDNDDKKAKIVKKRDAKLAEIRQQYFK